MLEINGNVLLGLQHNEAIEVVKQTPDHVQVVICRERGPGPEGGNTTTNTGQFIVIILTITGHC